MTFGGCGGSGDTVSVSVQAQPTGRYDAVAVVSPPRRAPDFVGHDVTGRTVRLSDFRGRAVVITFVYANCPDVCPLIVAKLRTALDLLGRRAREVAVVAVSVDPRGDTPESVKAFIRGHGMTGRMAYLTGSRAELQPLWRAYHVSVLPRASGRTVVGHSAVLFGITGTGREQTVYAADNFQPSAIAHDVPLLASR